MKQLKQSKSKMSIISNLFWHKASICRMICCFVVLGVLFFGCTGNNAESPVSHTEKTDSNDSDDTKITGEITKEETGLPSLYSSLSATPLSLGMNPVHLDGHNTFLPFPSDIVAYRDEASPTGVRLKLDSKNFPPEIHNTIKKIPEWLHFNKLFKEPDGSDADGFSIASNVLFEFDREVDPAWVCDEDENMARDGGDTFYLMDLTTGEFIPALVKESHFAKDPQRSTRDYVMQVMARKRFEYSRRYMAFVTNNFKDKNGNDFSCSSGFEKAKSKDGSPVSKFYEPWLKYLESEKGIDREEILSATIFTTRSREASVGPLIDMYNTVLEDNFTDEDVHIHGNYYVPIFPFERIVYGRINMRDFRDEEGVLRYSPGCKGTRDKDVADWVPFLLFIPHHTFPKPYPVNISGSGIVMTKEMMTLTALANATLGVATISIDWPTHGERGITEGVDIWELVGFSPGSVKENGANLPRLFSMFMQIPIDIMSTYRALTTYFDNSDKKGIRDLDMENLSYTGVSLGSLGGVSASACIPNLKGTFLSVAPVNFNKLLSSGTFLLGTVSLSIPEGLPGSWYALVMNGIVAQRADVFDGLHYADGFRYGVPEMGTGPRPLMATHAKNDGWVTTESGIALQEIAELPVIYSQDEIKANDVTGFLNNMLYASGAENNLEEYGNYGMAKVTVMNNDWKMNEIFDALGISEMLPVALYGYDYDWYDWSGTLEHALNAFNAPMFYYMMNFINNVQCDGNADNLYNAIDDFDKLSGKK